MPEQTQTTNMAPWGPQGDFLRMLWSRGDTLSQTQQPYYPGQTVTPFSPQSEQALGLMAARGLSGTPGTGAFGDYLNSAFRQGQIGLGGTANTIGAAQSGIMPGMNQLAATAGGGYLGRNPFLDAQFGQAAGQLTDAFGQAAGQSHLAFSGAGRSGSGAHLDAIGRQQDSLSRGLGTLGANLYGGAYEAERGRQLQAGLGLQQGALQAGGLAGNIFDSIDQSRARAGALLPSLQQVQYGDLDRLLGVGQAVEGKAGQYQQSDQDRFNYYRDQPWQQLQRFGSLLQGGPYGQSGTTTTDAAGNPIGQALGGGLAGAGIGSAFGPWGTAIGGGVGLLAGLFS